MLRPGLKAVQYGRVSSRTQHHRKNLDAQEAYCKFRLRKLGVPTNRVYREIGAGWSQDRERLQAAAAYAKEIGVVLVAESADRFLRSQDFNTKKRPDVLPSHAEWEKLKESTLGVRLVTILPPDMHWRAVRSHQSRRGQRGKGRLGGRPKNRADSRRGPKKLRRLLLLDDALEMRDQGLGLGTIAKELGIPKSTIQRWTKGCQFSAS